MLVALSEGKLALEEGDGLLVLGEVGGCLTVLADAGEVEAHLRSVLAWVGRLWRIAL